MQHDWAELFGHPDRVPLTGTTTPAEIQALVGAPSATSRQGRLIRSHEYWPERLGALWVFTWYGSAFTSIEVNFRDRDPAPQDPLPDWVNALDRAPAELEDFRRQAAEAGLALDESDEGDGWLLLRHPGGAGTAVTAEAKFLDRRLYSLELAWPAED